MIHRVARCTAGGRDYFIELSGVASIQQSNVVAHLPTAAAPEGHIETAQGTIPVYSVAHLLSGSAAGQFVECSLRSYCLIVSHHGRRWGLMVVGIQRATELPAASLLSLPSDLSSDWCLGAADPTPLADVLSTQTEPDAANSQVAATSSLLLVLNPVAMDGTKPLILRARRETSAPAADSPIGLAATVAEQRSTIRQLVLFDLNHQVDQGRRVCVALNAAQVAEVTGLQPIVELPLAPHGVLGLIHWRGRAVPVLNLAESFGTVVEDSTTSGSHRESASIVLRIAIVRRPQSDDHIAFVTSSNIRTQTLDGTPSQSRPELAANSPLLLGVFDRNHETLLIPDLNELLRVARSTSVAM